MFKNNKKKDVTWQKLVFLGVLLTLSITFFTISIKSYTYQSGDPNPTPFHPTSQPPSSNTPSETSTASITSLLIVPEQTLEKIDVYKSSNADTVAWLKIPGTSLNDPIVKAVDNDFYLLNNFDKESDERGALYADYRNKFGPASDSLSRNTVIYGHSMKDGSMFSQIFPYKELDFLNENPIIEFTVNGETEYRWKIFSCMVTDISFYYIEPDPDDETFNNIITEAKIRSSFQTNVDVNVNDKILTLSTCTYELDSDDIRFVVMARALRPNESEDVDPAVKNPAPKQPKV